MRTIAILGGGFSGVTTGVVLQLLGYQTTLYTARRADDGRPAAHLPSFASLYPAASILPHLVHIDDLDEHMRLSTAFFDRLTRVGDSGVRWQPHVEAFEEPPEPLPYIDMLRNARRLPEEETAHTAVPRRAGVEAMYGWRGEMLFAETPVYCPYLYELYRMTGGEVKTQTLTSAIIRNLSEDIIVNCTGLGTLDLFADPHPYEAIRGCLLYATPPDAPLDVLDGQPFSYNYMPTADVYQAADGAPVDVHFYPRRDVWVLGGSRRHGTIEDGAWVGDAIAGRALTIDGQEIPAPVLELNRELIRDLTGYDVADSIQRATYGYRFARDLDGEGVRLELAYEHDHPVVHNYGHGGAGVTLSWSCAVVVARLLHDEDLLGSSDRKGVEFPPRRAVFFADLQKLAAREVFE